MAIPESFIQDVLHRTDVVDVVGQYVQLKRTGANFSGLCPFHNEKTPSFTVSPTKQFYHCFGCGKNGNAISFLMEHLGYGFIDALKALSQSAGLEMPQDNATPQERMERARTKSLQTQLTEVMQTTVNYYCTQLKHHPEAQQYLKNRGVSPEIAGQYRLGYAPEGWQSLAQAFSNYDDALLEQAGLVIHKTAAETSSGKDKRYDRFRERIIFPIRNVKGENIGLGGRILGKGEPKYLNSPETPIFHKGRELYGLFEARTSIQNAGYCLVTEGYMDVIALAAHGFQHSVASLGTACTGDHIHKLFRFTDSVVFAFDGDRAGQAAAGKALRAALPQAQDGRSVKFVFLPPEHDPDSYVRQHGKDAFSRLIAEATPLSQLLIDTARAGCNLDQAEGRAKFLHAAQPLWQPLPNGALKQQLLQELATQGGITASALQEIWHAQQARTQRFQKPDNARGAVQGQRSGQQFEQNSRKKTYNNGRASAFSGSNRPAPSSRPSTHGGVRQLPQDQLRLQRAAQILLSRLELWGALSIHQQDLLCTSPAPYAPLFAWLDDVHTENNGKHNDGESLTWAQMLPRIVQSPHAQLAQQLMRQVPSNIAPSEDELHNILFQLALAEKEAQARALAQRAGKDPQAFTAYQHVRKEIAHMKVAHAKRKQAEGSGN